MAGAPREVCSAVTLSLAEVAAMLQNPRFVGMGQPPPSGSRILACMVQGLVVWIDLLTMGFPNDPPPPPPPFPPRAPGQGLRVRMGWERRAAASEPDGRLAQHLRAGAQQGSNI
jgi:hypothetical protein